MSTLGTDESPAMFANRWRNVLEQTVIKLRGKQELYYDLIDPENRELRFYFLDKGYR